MNIAMWSGPRNLSTALMYSFGARADFDVIDEPFYAAYLRATGSDHPMRAEILAAMEGDPARVAAQILAQGNGHTYVKHMTHHMIPSVPRDWFSAVTHTFLIRHPARVIASYTAKRERPSLEDIGFPQQADIFDQVCKMGRRPIVVDSFDIRADPPGVLQKLCEALELDWDPAMLSWPKGGHAADGVWAQHWYGAVHGSTGFAGAEGALPELDGWAAELSQAAMPFYTQMKEHRLR